jgi:hypothetical protein
MNPQIDHQDFLHALAGLAQAYAILSRAIAKALPPQLAAVAAVDPLTRITLEQFGEPLVRWFGQGSQLRGVHVADGTVVLEADAVHFLGGVAAEHDRDLPDDWRQRSRVIARIDGGILTPS